MKISVLTKVAAVMVFAVSGGGCAYHVAFNPTHVPPTAALGSVKIPGKALLYTEASDDAFIYRDRPSSLTGGGSTLVMPLGAITRDVAAQVFGSVFSSGCDRGSSFPAAPGYAAILRPRVLAFDYRYNSLRNWTMAMTPQIKMTMEVTLYDESGASYATRRYDTDWYNGRTVLDTLQPAELINVITHEKIAQLLMTAAGDLQPAMASRAVKQPVPAQPLQPAAGAKSENSGTPVPQGDVQTRLKELKKLFDDGLISKEAYEKKQKEILEKL